MTVYVSVALTVALRIDAFADLSLELVEISFASSCFFFRGVALSIRSTILEANFSGQLDNLTFLGGSDRTWEVVAKLNSDSRFFWIDNEVQLGYILNKHSLCDI